jgi:hypothetical protein
MATPKKKNDIARLKLAPEARQLRAYYLRQVRSLDRRIDGIRARALVLDRERSRLMKSVADIDNPDLPFAL